MFLIKFICLTLSAFLTLSPATLNFKWNGQVVPASGLQIKRTTEEVEGETLLTRLDIFYVPSEVVCPGTNTVTISIDDKVGNKLEPQIRSIYINPFGGF